MFVPPRVLLSQVRIHHWSLICDSRACIILLENVCGVEFYESIVLRTGSVHHVLSVSSTSSCTSAQLFKRVRMVTKILDTLYDFCEIV